VEAKERFFTVMKLEKNTSVNVVAEWLNSFLLLNRSVFMVVALTSNIPRVTDGRACYPNSARAEDGTMDATASCRAIYS
jgi:hypothetical protein